MTHITYHHARGPSRSSLQAIPSILTGFVVNFFAAWRRRQNMRILEALPQDTLKDIGWPTTETTPARLTRK
jgi:uncharacterized protein YjiS (DUF1127 family)